MRVTSTKAADSRLCKIVVVGPTGAGKTSLAKTLPPDKTLIISNERGLLPLAGHDFTVWTIDSWDDLQTAYQELLKPEIREKFKVVFVDSLTEMNELCKDHIIKKERPGKKIEIGKVYDDLLTMQDYQLLDTKMRRMIRSFRDLDMHVVFTCLEDERKDEQTGFITFVPALNGKLAFQLGAYFDEIFRLITQEVEKGKPHARYLNTGKTDKNTCKDRSGALEFMEEPDLSAIFGKILAKFETKKEAVA